MKKRMAAFFLVLVLALGAASAFADPAGDLHKLIDKRGGGSAPGAAKNTVYMFN